MFPQFMSPKLTKMGDASVSARWSRLPGAAVIALITLAAYVPTMRGGFIWDDDAYVIDNTELRTTAGLARIWFDPSSEPQYYPLVHTTLWVEYQLWGLNSHGYHLTNVVLHIAGALLLWGVLRHLEVPGAFLAAALFAVHPVQVESVGWITERKNVLSGVMYFLCLRAYLRFCPLRDRAGAAAGQWRFYGLAFAFFVAALLSKTVTCSLPAVIVLLLWWKRRRLRVAEIAPLIPFFVIGLLLAMITVRLEVEHVGAKGEEWSLTAVQRCLIAGRALWFYAEKLVWPHSLCFNYTRWQVDAGQWWQYLFPAGALAVVAVLWTGRARFGKGPLAAVLVFAGTLLPALGFFNVYPFQYSYVADHFQYLASIGLIVLGVVLANKALRRWRGLPVRVVSVVVVGVFVVLTWRQGRIYADLPTLWNDTLAKNPDSWLANGAMGAYYLKQTHPEEAIPFLERAIELRPSHGGLYSNLGMAYCTTGRPAEGIPHLERAAELDPGNANLHNNLGQFLAQQGRIEDAIGHFKEALRLRPNFGDAHFNLGSWLPMVNKLDQAAEHLEKVLELDPADTQARAMLQRLRAAQGRGG